MTSGAYKKSEEQKLKMSLSHMGIPSWKSGKKDCKRGHLYTPENTRISVIDGTRICRKCNCILTTRYYYKNIIKKTKYNKAYKKKHPEIARASAEKWRLKNKEKFKTHSQVRRALLSNKIKKSSCEVCGSKKVDGHHPDYSKPLEVRWLCRLHHVRLHKSLKLLGGSLKL